MVAVRIEFDDDEQYGTTEVGLKLECGGILYIS